MKGYTHRESALLNSELHSPSDSGSQDAGRRPGRSAAESGPDPFEGTSVRKLRLLSADVLTETYLVLHCELSRTLVAQVLRAEHAGGAGFAARNPRCTMSPHGTSLPEALGKRE
jgi:hypothetical protein